MATKKADVVAAIKEGNKALGKAIADGDAKAAAAMYTKTAKLLPSGVAALKTTAAITRYWQGAIDMGISGVQLRTLEVDVLGSMANERGSYTLKNKKGKVLDKGKYVVVWKKSGRKWKLHWDIFNTDNG